MKRIHQALSLPVEDFELPPTVGQIEVCGETYQVASKNCPVRLNEVFIPGAEPKEVCPKHSGLVQRPQDKKDQGQSRPFHF